MHGLRNGKKYTIVRLLADHTMLAARLCENEMGHGADIRTNDAIYVFWMNKISTIWWMFCESVCTMYSMPQYSWCTHTSRPGTSKQVKQKNTIDGRKEIIRNNHNHHQRCWRALLYTREKGGNNFLLSIRSWTNRKKIVSTLMI